MINRKTEEEVKLQNPDNEKRRREALKEKNLQDYEQLCAELLESKNLIYMSVSQKVMSKCGISDKEIGEALQHVNPMEMEAKMHG